VRRRWPRSLISWARLLSGRITDPLVGRDVLVGSNMAVAAILLVLLANEITVWSGQPPPRLLELDLDLLLGPAELLAKFAVAPVLATVFGMFTLLLLLGLRVLTRGSNLAAGAFIIVWTLVMAAGWGAGPGQILVYAGMAAVFAVTLMRFGLLAMCVGALMATLDVPVTARLSTWYATPGILASGLVFGLVGFAVWASLRGRTVIERWLEEP
jgi:hypothetical protein